MSDWHCDACGQRIRHAREGWISIRLEGGRSAPMLVHHRDASPWAAWGGCEAVDEFASLHLTDALRDPLALAQLAALELLHADQLPRLQARVLGTRNGWAEALPAPTLAPHFGGLAASTAHRTG